jgi:hypothetical protein
MTGLPESSAGGVNTRRWAVLCTLLFAAAALLPGQQNGPASEPKLTREQQEQFLLNAEITNSRGVSKGITGTWRVTLSDGKLTHDASVQTIDEYRARFESAMGSEINFKDSYKFNLAAYKLDGLLGLYMIPATVERKYRGSTASFTWWVEDVIMDELERTKRKITPPDLDNWNNQMYVVRMFDQLIYNMDRNLGNLLIDRDWRIWMIDHGRAFRIHREVKEPKNLTRLERGVLAKLKELNEQTVKAEMGRWLNGEEIKALLSRRDKIVSFYEKKGPEALYDFAFSPR